MGQMRKALVVAVVAACSKGASVPGSPSLAEDDPVPAPDPRVDESQQPAAATPIPGCTPDASPTLASLAAVYRAWAKRGPYDSSYNLAEAMSLNTLERGVVELTSHPCCDIPLGHLGYAWRCTFYPTRNDVARAILVADGWQDVDKRVELARAIEPLLVHGLDAEPTRWDKKYPFSAPEFAQQQDGSVVAVRWVQEVWCGFYCKHEYVKQQIAFKADASIVTKELDRYRVPPPRQP
jgi:hypothetical protein